MTLTDLCERLRNWFDVRRHFGTFTIENGTIDLDFIREGRFYRLIGGGYKNNGVFFYNGERLEYIKEIYHKNDGSLDIKYDETEDETFTGAVWELDIKKSFIEFYATMCDWQKQNAKVLNSPFQSESFGGYSYSKVSGSNGALTVWDNFASDLARWQKL